MFPEVEVDMRFEDIASGKIDEGRTQPSWLRKRVLVFAQCSPDGTERRDGRTVLVRRKRLRIGIRKKFNNRKYEVQVV